MSWSAWMPIQDAGYSGAQPYAVFVSGFQRYATNWQRPEWRYDRTTGYVEYRGLINVPAARNNGNEPMIITYLPASPGLPIPTKNYLLQGMSNQADRVYGQPYRLDIQPYAGAHHVVRCTNGTGLAAGTWIWLELLWSASDYDPDWYPWRQVGVNANGVLATFGPGWSNYADPPWSADFRFTKDYKRWQWRALLKGPTLGTAPPYDNIVTVSHPNPQTLGNCLNHALINYYWAGGEGAAMRVDNRQHAGGHRLDIVSAVNGTVPAWFGLILDYCTTL